MPEVGGAQQGWATEAQNFMFCLLLNECNVGEVGLKPVKEHFEATGVRLHMSSMLLPNTVEVCWSFGFYLLIVEKQEAHDVLLGGCETPCHLQVSEGVGGTSEDSVRLLGDKGAGPVTRGLNLAQFG